ncbi:aa3-type cytochrome c oxidase subunit IV [Arvimicrobium flavum]|uniref:aa3-type cytochrome c oxidase subunit IV n=1 Tax=Arvimicrobium flavum TaxID=3393320 RepID=UPI00237A56E9|nr:aa3-type cytochrome c oxidase subunit IV [Mesorhizobium shangrilense]
MADHSPTGPVELGAQMDYAEHDKTYQRFIALAKYGSLFCVALMIAMAFGFFTSAGFFSATILFIIVCAVGGYLLRDVPTHIT